MAQLQTEIQEVVSTGTFKNLFFLEAKGSFDWQGKCNWALVRDRALKRAVANSKRLSSAQGLLNNGTPAPDGLLLPEGGFPVSMLFQINDAPQK